MVISHLQVVNVRGFSICTGNRLWSVTIPFPETMRSHQVHIVPEGLVFVFFFFLSFFFKDVIMLYLF